MQKKLVVLLIEGILQFVRTILTTLSEGCPNLSRHKAYKSLEDCFVHVFTLTGQQDSTLNEMRIFVQVRLDTGELDSEE